MAKKKQPRRRRAPSESKWTVDLTNHPVLSLPERFTRLEERMAQLTKANLEIVDAVKRSGDVPAAMLNVVKWVVLTVMETRK